MQTRSCIHCSAIFVIKSESPRQKYCGVKCSHDGHKSIRNKLKQSESQFRKREEARARHALSPEKPPSHIELQAAIEIYLAKGGEITKQPYKPQLLLDQTELDNARLLQSLPDHKDDLIVNTI